MADYQDVETLLFRGFLTSKVELGPVPLVLKSLNNIEYDQLDLRSYSSTNGWEVQASYILAYATVFFNHVNVLPNREECIPLLVEHYQMFPKSIIVALLKVVTRLNEKAGQALHKLQGYSCGVESRQMWRMYRGIPLCDQKVTGFSGTDCLGINMHQRMWAYFNSLEDEEEGYLRDYGLAKFIVSPHAPKDVKRIDAKDRQRAEDMSKRKKALYQGKNYVSEGQKEIYVTKDSAEELMSQMQKEMRGERDYHDLVIEQHKARIRAAYIKQREEQERRRKEAYEKQLRREVEEVSDTLAGEGYSAEEIAHYLSKSDHLRRLQRQKRPADYQNIAEKEARLIRWGFLDEEDIPESRRAMYTPKSEKDSPDFENPLIEEHYERVSDDLRARFVGPDEDS